MKPSTSRALAKVVAITKGRGYEAPHAALLITNALRAVLQETASLQNAAGLMYTLWAPYGGAVGFLGEAARPYHNAEDRWKLIREAQDWFKNARAYAPDQFCKALAEWQLGNSCVLLGDKEEAKDWYQRAHTSAIGYLHDRERAVTAPQDRYAKYANYIPDEVLTAAQAIPEPSLSQAVVFARSAKLGLKSWYAYATEKNRKQFVEKEAPPVLDLIDALEELQRQAPALVAPH